MVDPDLQISGVIQTAWDKEGGGGVSKNFFWPFGPYWVWSKNKGPSPGSATDKSHLAERFFDFFTVKKKSLPWSYRIRHSANCSQDLLHTKTIESVFGIWSVKLGILGQYISSCCTRFYYRSAGSFLAQRLVSSKDTVEPLSPPQGPVCNPPPSEKIGRGGGEAGSVHSRLRRREVEPRFNEPLHDIPSPINNRIAA